MDLIRIFGARQHNLKNVDLDIPRLRFTVITGVSGSGKSSLAFDTLFAEGQRRYVEALSTYARQFLQNVGAPLVDDIEGLSPAIAIEQKGLPRTPRSTVGTLTEIHDHLRLLYARLGTIHCPACAIPVRAYTVPEMVREIYDSWPEGSRLLVIAPLAEIRERELSATLKKLRRDGFARIRLDGRVFELDPLPVLPRRPAYRLEVVVDRLILGEKIARRLADSLELASGLGGGLAAVAKTEGVEMRFSTRSRCNSCGREFPELSPSLFSFQHPNGMCPACKGLGFAGDEADEKGAERESAADRLANGSTELPCPACSGARLNETARSVRLGGLTIPELAALPLPAVRQWIANLDLPPARAQIAERPIQEMLRRLENMEKLGLAYLTLSRASHTLSGGEAQRIRLAHQTASSLSGILYVLDEPSIGLHPRDHRRLLDVLFRLRDSGNTVVVVEHDRETILRADYVVDMGPGAGTQGGQVIFHGPPEDLVNDPDSLTGLYLSGRREIAVPQRRRRPDRGSLVVTGARGHNLKGITVSFPLGCITCVTGVSGSGKSTLVLQTLYRALARDLYGSKAAPAPFERIENARAVKKVVLVDQAPIGRTPRSTPATYSGLFDLIRGLYSRLPEARARGYGANRFSFNAGGGRCETCKGEGLQRIEMYFLPDVYVTCPECGGSRYNRETLDILFKGKSIADALEMTVQEAAPFFESFPALRAKMDTLLEVGLGYLRLGQPATTLSGGEAQRVKLAAELSRKASGGTLYILDEPTTGLHFEDVQKLLHVLQRLADLGHTVIIIEHHLDVVKTADYVIDLGPEGGDQGGHVVASGTPEQVAQVESSFTGRYLRQVLGRSAAPADQPS